MMECGTVTQYCKHTRELVPVSQVHILYYALCRLVITATRLDTTVPALEVRPVRCRIGVDRTHREECAEGVHRWVL